MHVTESVFAQQTIREKVSAIQEKYFKDINFRSKVPVSIVKYVDKTMRGLHSSTFYTFHNIHSAYCGMKLIRTLNSTNPALF